MAQWTNYQIFLALMMLITGSINTLSTKWADNSSAAGLGPSHPFNHPFLQAVGMFIGEFSCLIVFNLLFCHKKRKGTEETLGNQQFNRFIFLPAAMCDMCGTSLLYIGLNLTYASSFQMLRGAVIVFTALLSVAFMGKRIHKHEWFGILLIIIGLALVGLSDVVFNGGGDSGLPQNNIITGDLIIIIAQVVVAFQMVYEQKYVQKYNVPPLQAVGYEGLFGGVLLGILLVPMYYIIVSPPFASDGYGHLENVFEAFAQMKNNWQILVATLGNIVSIAFFNFSGISVSKEISATTRMVLDSCRTLVIWVVSLAVGWQPFTWQSFLLQSCGFLILMAGMCLYNEIVIVPCFLRIRACCTGQPLVLNVNTDSDDEDEHAGLLAHHVDPATDYNAVNIVS